MKSIIPIFSFFFGLGSAAGQSFESTITNTGSTLFFKIKPTGTITDDISYAEFNIRYSTSNNLTFGSPVNSNGFNILADVEETFGGFKYKKFVHTGSCIPSATYTSGVEYTVFQVTVTGTGTGTFQLASNQNSIFPNDYVFSVNDCAAGSLVNVGANLYFYPLQMNIGSDYWMELSGFPLPVELTAFDAKPEKTNVLVTWQTASETQNSHFDIERSSDGTDFQAIGRLAGKGTTTDLQNYEWLDRSPLPGTSYYRLRQVDEDGSFTFSQVRQVEFAAEGHFSVFPNPSQGDLTLVFQTEEEGEATVRVLDLAGRMLHESSWQVQPGENRQELPLGGQLKAGSYFLEMRSGSFRETRPLVIRR